MMPDPNAAAYQNRNDYHGPSMQDGASYPRPQPVTPSESDSGSRRPSAAAGPRPMRADDRSHSGGSLPGYQQPQPVPASYQQPMPVPAGYQQPQQPAPHTGAYMQPHYPPAQQHRQSYQEDAGYFSQPGSNHPSAQPSPVPSRRQYAAYPAQPAGYHSANASQPGSRVGSPSASPPGGRRQQPMPRGPSIETLGHDATEMTSLSPSRFQTVRRKVPLKTGNFVVDFPVSQQYLDLCPEKTGTEFTHVRYTAVTCDPNEFGQPSAGYMLRPKLYNRQTELFIVMTMYNEGEDLFAKTMTSVQKNIAYLCSPNCPVSWGPNGWQNVVVCIVADGRTKINKRVLTALEVMGIYTPGLERSEVEGKPVTGHIYEFTTQIALDKDRNIRLHKQGIVPVQVLFCLKEKNAKKINSHRWFFNAFGPVLNPNVCVLLDVGTKPTGTSIFHLWRAFDRDPQVGGACGEIVAELGSGCRNLTNPLVAAQNFEYKMSNILDKPLESVFGYIQVLPGAFSAYRYKALQNSSPNTGPLASYFEGENHTGATDVFKANMYLAEDRILCFELVTKRNENWVLKYVKNAQAETDVPDALAELVSQRRRWLNGSFFAAVHSATNYKLFFRSSHSRGQLAMFTFQELYNVFNLIFSWFAIGNFYLTFHFLFQSAANPDPALADLTSDPFHGSGGTVFDVLRYLYFGAVGVLIVISFGNRPQGTKSLYYAILVLFAILMGFLLFMGGHTVYEGIPKTNAEWAKVGDKLINQPAFRDIVISLASTYGLYIISSLLHMDPWHCVTSMPQYLILLPVYINIFNVYAFCNLHDISWGTKGDNKVEGAGAAPAVKAKDGAEEEVVVDLPQDDQEALNLRYQETLETLVRKPEKAHEGRDAKTKLDDYFRLYRTRVVLSWIISNVLLIIIFTTSSFTDVLYAHVQDKGKGAVNPYLAFLFWSVTTLSTIRFIGSTWYIITWLMEGVAGVGRKQTFVPSNQAANPHAGSQNRAKGG
ncbi:Chitin synthase, class 1 [Geranomyces variabilis]|nr:Chitin synthase, class 1 [Geranomyces variabilis]